MRLEMTFTRIDQLKAQLDAHRPLPAATLASLREDLILRWTYHSNAIEGNTLTLNETKVVLEGITIGGKSLREHFEVINHRDAILYVEDVVRGQESFSEWQIKNLHRLVLKNIDHEQAGRYRTIDVKIAGARHDPPPHYRVAEQMAEFLIWYHHAAGSLHPVARAVEVHTRLVLIHPFIDGNGRTARLLLNLELLKAGYWPVVLPVEARLRYYETLDAAWDHDQPGDLTPITRLVADYVEQGLVKLIAFLNGVRN
ncbi:MAG: Fic family protein [Candidatus Competibacteraceae bacterium]|nr:Fic family protein [Candidatus Competibacteraceae bacterium]